MATPSSSADLVTFPKEQSSREIFIPTESLSPSVDCLPSSGVGEVPYNKVLAITLYRRPEHTQKLFHYLANCVGIDDYTILIHIDGDPSKDIFVAQVETEVLRFRQSRAFMNIQLHTAMTQRGIDESKLFILQLAYEQSDFVILLEDDTWPSPGTLKFIEYAYMRYKDMPGFVSVTGYNYHHKEASLEEFTELFPFANQTFNGFYSWIWGMSKKVYDRWVGLYNGEKYRRRCKDKGWPVNGEFDWSIRRFMEEKPTYYFSVRPLLSYTMLLDAFSGATHTRSQKWFEEEEMTYIHQGMLEKWSKPSS